MVSKVKYDDNLNWKDYLLLIVIAVLFGWIFLFGMNALVGAAYSLSDHFVTSGQVQKAEELGAIERTELEVVNNYGEQDTFNPQQAGRNE